MYLTYPNYDPKVGAGWWKMPTLVTLVSVAGLLVLFCGWIVLQAIATNAEELRRQAPAIQQFGLANFPDMDLDNNGNLEVGELLIAKDQSWSDPNARRLIGYMCKHIRMVGHPIVPPEKLKDTKDEESWKSGNRDTSGIPLYPAEPQEYRISRDDLRSLVDRLNLVPQ